MVDAAQWEKIAVDIAREAGAPRAASAAEGVAVAATKSTSPTS
jgi:myo-inositol-1(or 4)-monophosphatase